LNSFETFDRLDFHHNQVLDEQVQPVSNVQRSASVGQRHWLLAFDPESSVCQLERQTRVVRGFEQARSKSSMDFDRGSNDLLGEAIQMFFHARRSMQDLCDLSVLCG
jgi:hypothetical protein